jgi:hypothetical protein
LEPKNSVTKTFDSSVKRSRDKCLRPFVRVAAMQSLAASRATQLRPSSGEAARGACETAQKPHGFLNQKGSSFLTRTLLTCTGFYHETLKSYVAF